MDVNIIGAVAGVLSCLCGQSCLHESISQQFRRQKRLKWNFNKLKSLMEELDARKVDVGIELEQMWLEKGMKPKTAVALWLKKVEKFAREVSELEDKIEQGNRRSCGSPSFVCLRIKLGELIEEKILEVTELLEKGQFSVDSLVETVTKKGLTLPTARLLRHETTMNCLTRISNYLLDGSASKIGVYGMGGVGKTAIMSEIYNHLLQESEPFDCVIWITVPKEINLEKLQKAIAEKVDVDVSELQDETTRASALSEALNRRKRFALILDDLWEPIALERVGIPMPTIANGCKVVITTRLLHVCRGMETDQDVEVKVLTEDEAWDLFKDKVGDRVLASREINLIAKKLAKKCMGLPLGIITVGRALRNATDISEWKNALAELNVSTGNIEQMEELVFSRLRFSFSKLKDDTSRSCFLFCAMYPQGHRIDTNELIEYWMWEGWFGMFGRTSECKRKGKNILNELRHACLLEGATENSVLYVKMHDLVRDMAIGIMNTNPLRFVKCSRMENPVNAGIGMANPHCIVNAGTGITNFPNIDERAENVERVSMMRNDLKSIPAGYLPQCPRLTTLLLQYNSFDKGIFFDFMPNLKVLDLSYTGVNSLPESLSHSENLRALLLSNCWNLTAVPSLAKLTKLMVLDLSCCQKMKKLPHGIEQLYNLRRLNVSNTRTETLPSGFLSELRHLEELLTTNSDVLWGVSTLSSIAGASIQEVISSSNLSSLELNFWNFELYEEYARSCHWQRLDKFKFIVGSGHDQFSEKRSIAFHGIFLDESHITIPPDTMELKLYECHAISQLTSFLSSVKQLKKCTILHCHHMECIVGEYSNQNSTMLEEMALSFLVNLQKICGEFFNPQTFMNLKVLSVDNCPRLRILFSGQCLLQLINLEEIRVSHCGDMEKLMIWEEEREGHPSIIQLPKLLWLRLEYLPKLEDICNGFIISDSLRSIEVISCDVLKRLPLAPDLCQQPWPPFTFQIRGTRQWWKSLEWHGDISGKRILQQHFVPLRAISDHVGSSSQAATMASSDTSLLEEHSDDDMITEIMEESIQDICDRN